MPKYSFFLTILLVGFVLFSSCERKVKSKEPKSIFSTNAASRLYFENMRQHLYRSQRQTGTKIDRYVLKKMDQFSKTRPLVFPEIVHDVVKEKAFIFIQKNKYENYLPDSLIIKWENDSTSETFNLGMADVDNQLLFAEKLLKQIQLKNKLQIKVAGNKWENIYEDDIDRRPYQIIMKDYFRLVERE